MRAAVLNAVGDDKLELRDDVRTVEPGPREVRIGVRASGICHSDLSAMDGTLSALTPGVIGHEGAGEVLQVGTAVEHLAPGDHVTVSFVPPCGSCASCLRGEPNLCSVHSNAAFTTPRFRCGETALFGFAGLGTFADELVVPASGAIKIDPEIPFETAALIACGVLTGVGAVLNTAKVPPGSTVVVLGCGGAIVIVGAGRGDAMVEFSAQELFLHDKKILGSFYGSSHVHRDTGRMLRFWRARQLDLEGMISKRLTFDDINDGLDLLRDGNTDVIRQVVTLR